jgi:endonuclease YncB( thermonuclease family)
MIILAAGSADEATGRISKVVNGNTFDVQLQTHDSRIAEDMIRIRLADIDCLEIHGTKACDAGKKAASYTRAWLLGKNVFLDLDNKTRKDQYGRWAAVCYLDDGGLGKNFNRQLVDAEQAVIEDFANIEFDPNSWWHNAE